MRNGKYHLQFHLFDLHLLEGQQDLEFLDPLGDLVSLQGQVHHDHPEKQNFNIIYLKRAGLGQRLDRRKKFITERVIAQGGGRVSVPGGV